MTPKIALFDADGVLTLPEEMFSEMYARSRGLAPEAFAQFFKNDWPEIVTGNKDLKEVIKQNPELWQWDGTVDELLDYWFKTEDVRNEPLLSLIAGARQAGSACYLATDQEKYRAQYMKDIMFKDLFDGYFISAELGVTKAEPKFFEQVFAQLQQRHSGLQPSDVIFFDDSQTKVDSARSVGMNGQLYTGIEAVKTFL